MSTKYNVIVNDTTVATKSKRQQAVDLAEQIRNDEKVAVTVVTTAGNVTLELAAPKKIRMSPRYTKVQALPEGVVLSDEVSELRVAYVRPQRNAAILHDTKADKDKQYVVVDLKTGKAIRQRFAKTRDAGRYINDGVGTAFRRELAEKRAAKAGGEQPAVTPAPEVQEETPVLTPEQTSELANA